MLNRKKFIFPEFSFSNFRDEIKLMEEESALIFCIEYMKRILVLMPTFIAARRSHPGNCKQSVPVAIAIFDPTTVAADTTYFPGERDTGTAGLFT